MLDCVCAKRFCFSSAIYMQMLAKPSSNLLQRTGGNHWGCCTQLG